MTISYRYLLFALPLMMAAPTFAQVDPNNPGILTFRNGGFVVDDLGDTDPSNDILYGGVEETEFRSADPGLTTPQGDNINITVDGDDGDNITMAAIRFSDLLVTEGGLLPNNLVGNPSDILRADLRLFVTSNADDDSNIELHRVISEDLDRLGGVDFWQEDDTFNSLTSFPFPTPGGDLFLEYPFNGQFDPDGLFRGSSASITGGPSEVTPERTAWVPTESEASTLTGFEQFKHTGTETSDVWGEDPDGDGNDLEADVIAGNFDIGLALETVMFDINVTEDVRTWFADGNFNTNPIQGWAVTNNTGNGWDFLTSEVGDTTVDPAAETTIETGPFDGDTIIAGLDFDETDGLDPLPPQFAYAFNDEMNPNTPTGIVVNAEYVRPQLIIEYLAGNGIADLNVDQLVNEDDLQIFIDNFGIEVDFGGALPSGARGDLDFDNDIDSADWLLFKEAFAAANPVLFGELFGTTSVPEPSTVALCVMASLALRFYARRR